MTDSLLPPCEFCLLCIFAALFLPYGDDMRLNSVFINPGEEGIDVVIVLCIVNFNDAND